MFMLDLPIGLISKRSGKALAHIQQLFQGRKKVLGKSENDCEPFLDPEICTESLKLSQTNLKVGQSFGQGQKIVDSAPVQR